jgi:hypothetical protein
MILFKHVVISILVLIVNSKYTLMETSACGYSPLTAVNVCLNLKILITTCLNILRGLKSFLLSSSWSREQSNTSSPPTPLSLSLLSSFSVFVQFTHINVIYQLRDIYSICRWWWNVATYKWCRSRYEGVSVVSCILSSVDAINIITKITVYKAIQDVIIGLHHNGTIHSPYSTNYIELHHNMQKFPEYNIELFFLKILYNV